MSDINKQYKAYYDKNRRKELREKHLCYKCLKLKENWNKGLCEACLEKGRIYRRAHPETQEHKLSKKEKYREQKRCLSCGKSKGDSVYLFCDKCRAKVNKRHEGVFVKRVKEGLCGNCGKEPVRAGLTTCVRCSKRATGEHRESHYKKGTIVFKEYGNKCACCGESNRFFLTIDHINNDGKEHRKVVPPGSFYRWIIENNFPKDLQILCYNCNFGKKRNNGICCPHKINVTA